MLEFTGEPDGTAAPRLAGIRPAGAELASRCDQLATGLRPGPARLRARWPPARNLLVHGGRLVMTGMPQIAGVIANPRGAKFLTRDPANAARWFTTCGLTGVTPAPTGPASLLLTEACLS